MRDLHTPSDIRSITRQLDEILIDYYVDPDQVPVLNFKPKRELIAALAEAYPPKKGVGLSKALEMFTEEILPASVKTWHPTFFNQMSAGASFPAVLGGTLASMMNCTLSTYEAAPAATVIERCISQWLAHLIGMSPGAGGIFLPGSSYGNFLALVIARNTRLNRDMGRKGLQGVPEQGVVICSEASHYSVANACNMLGLGSERLIQIKTNYANEMLVEDVIARIEEAKGKGLRPFALVATLGLTVTGGFDPMQELIPICREHDIHLHIDAAFGGGMTMTSEGPRLFKGIEQADTVTWDAHKWLHAPLTCTALLAPNPDVFKRVFNPKAPYLFHDDDENHPLAENLGHFTPMCGKQFNALPLWLMFKAYGEDWLREQAEDRLIFIRELAAKLHEDEDFHIPFEPRSPVVCFRFMPKKAEEIGLQRLNELQKLIRERIREMGLALFNIAEVKEVLYFRFILINPLTTLDDMLVLMDEIRKVGWALLEGGREG